MASKFWERKRTNNLLVPRDGTARNHRGTALPRSTPRPAGSSCRRYWASPRNYLPPSRTLAASTSAAASPPAADSSSWASQMITALGSKNGKDLGDEARRQRSLDSNHFWRKANSPSQPLARAFPGELFLVLRERLNPSHGIRFDCWAA